MGQRFSAAVSQPIHSRQSITLHVMNLIFVTSWGEHAYKYSEAGHRVCTGHSSSLAATEILYGWTGDPYNAFKWASHNSLHQSNEAILWTAGNDFGAWILVFFHATAQWALAAERMRSTCQHSNGRARRRRRTVQKLRAERKVPLPWPADGLGRNTCWLQPVFPYASIIITLSVAS